MAIIHYITQVNLDFGAISSLRAECERIGMRKPLVVTDAGVRAAGVLDRALAALGDHPFAVFDQTPSNPTELAVRAAVDLLKKEGCDGLIGVGGGSSLDLAKGTCIAATHAGPLKTYATIEGGSLKISDQVLPLIAVPTTAGTGSEVARGPRGNGVGCGCGTARAAAAAYLCLLLLLRRRRRCCCRRHDGAAQALQDPLRGLGGHGTQRERRAAAKHAQQRLKRLRR